jgi:two-component system response regulator YesN
MHVLLATFLGSLRHAFSRPDISLSSVARDLGVSYWRLSHLLTLRTGLGFDRHLAGWRILKAVELLDVGALSVKEVSASLGYSHATCFSRQFSRMMHMSPREFGRALHQYGPPVRGGCPPSMQDSDPEAGTK